jgi:crotonobetainyl-CoA:carnitine CoA-transferase CaiB-like acyl-CoA transferase
VTCADNQRIALHLSSPDKFWKGLITAIQREDLAEKYADRGARVSRYDELAIDLAQAFVVQPRAHWLPLLEANDVPFAPERRLEDLVDDPQVQHLDVFYEIDHPRYGHVRAAHRPIRYDGDHRSDFLPPPDLGEHTQDVLRAAGIGAETMELLKSEGSI